MRGRRADSLLPVAIDRESGNSSRNAQRIVHFVIIELSPSSLFSTVISVMHDRNSTAICSPTIFFAKQSVLDKIWNLQAMSNVTYFDFSLSLSLSLYRKTRSAQKSLFYEGVKMYNSLPANIKQSDRLKTFKRQLKEYILDRIKYV